ncbi:MAG: hypothetical protein FD124_3820, partial [Alphaproteobacteria bacterium]
MTRSIMLASAIVLSGALGACATKTGTAAAPLAVQYTVVREDVTIPFSRTVNNFRVGLDRSLLLETGHHRWYRATLSPPCQSDLRWEERIALADRASTSVSKFTDVIVDGHRCQILTLDEIGDPKVAEDAAR